MAENKPADTVPNLGFKDKDKALETIKALEGRDPDYQKLAIKGLIGRANRVLTITKAEDKLKNIKDALSVFDDWLKNFEKLNLSKENLGYLPMTTVKVFKSLGKHYNIDNSKFIKAYEKTAESDYKKLRTIESNKDEPTWDIVRNTNLKKLLKELNSKDNVPYWDDDGLPSKEHVELILWAYSPEATKLKKTLSSLEEKVKKLVGDDSADDDDESGKDSSKESDENKQNEKVEKKASKRKSDGKKSGSPEKKKKPASSSSSEESDDD